MPGKRGAPYGNTNAWKHGRYSRDMSLETIDALGLTEDDLVEEIAIQRMVLQRMIEYYGETSDKKELIKGLGKIGKTAMKVQRLILLKRQVGRVRSSGQG